MKVALSQVLVLVAASLLLTNSLATADDWPGWMGPGMKGVIADKGLVETFPDDGLPVVWRQPIGIGYSGPSIVGSHAYITDWKKTEAKGDAKPNRTSSLPGTERVLCLDMKTGKTVWQHQYDCSYNVAYPNGPRCTPTVDGDRVYTLGAMGDLICFDRKDGTIKWQKKLTEVYKTKPPFWGYSSHPMVDGEHLLMPVGGEGSAVVCFNKMTGEEVWKNVTSSDVAYVPLVIHEGNKAASSNDSENASTKAQRQLLFWHADGVHSLDPATGKEFWNVVWPEEKQQPQATTIVTPQIRGNLFFVSEFYRGSLLLDIGSTPPSVKEVYRTFKEDPRHKSSLNALMTTPIIKDGLVYGITGMGEMRCNDLQSGELKWSNSEWLEGKGAEAQTFATAFIVGNGDRHFLFTDLGELIIGSFSPDGFEESARTKILEPTFTTRGRTVVWSHPAFADGKMVARNDKEIVCVDLKKPAQK